MNEEEVKATTSHRATNPADANQAGEGTLRTLGELEQHFERIKKLHAQTAQRESELERLASEIDRRTREVEARAADLEEKVQRIDADRAALDDERSAVAAAREELRQSQAKYEEDRRALEGEQRSAAEFSEKAGAMRAELENRERAVATAEAKLGADLATLGEEQRNLQGATESLASDRAVLEKLLAESGTRDEALSAREKSLDERERAVAAGQERVAGLQRSVEETRTQLEQQRAALAEERERLEAGQRDADTAQKRLAAMMKAVQARAAELDGREKAIAEREKALQQGAAVAQDTERAADKQVKQLEEALVERAALIASRDAEIASLRTEAERLTGEMKKAQAAAQSAAKAAASAPAPKAPARTPEPNPALDHELEKSRRAIELLAEKLRASQKECDRLKQRVEVQSSRPATPPAARADAGGRIKADPHNVLRRRRLQKYKSLLQTQARKIMSAQAALAKRQAEADQILSHRAKLAAAAEQIRARELRINSQRAKSAGAGLLFSFAASAAALAAISWFAATRIAPATYVAAATIEAETRARGKSQTDLEGWQAFHQELVSDPQLIGQAAERAGRRGIKDLATPAALQAYLKDALVIESPKDGQMVMHLKGSDAARTAMLLDTYVTAVAATANMSRVQRPDGLVTEITRPVATPDAPIEHERFVYAGAIFGGSMMMAMMLGGIGWRRVARAKSSAADADAVETFLDQTNWPRQNP